MLKKIKKNIISSLLITGVFTMFAEAGIPNAPGPYVGVTDINKTAVRIGFLDNSDNENGFTAVDENGVVYQPTPIPSNDETINSYVYHNLEGLICNKMYKIKVLAYNNDGNSSFSDERDFNIKTTFGIPCPVSPNAPGPYIGVTDINDTAVRINFLDNSDNEEGFRVIGNGIDELIGANTAPASTQVYHNIENLICDKLYTIKALAYNSDGNSSFSDDKSFRIESTFGVNCNNPTVVPNAPGPYIGITDINDTTIRINFLDNSNDEDGFKVFLDGVELITTIPEKTEPISTQVYYNIPNLTCNQDYTIKVVAYNGVGDSDSTDERIFNIHETFDTVCP